MIVAVLLLAVGAHAAPAPGARELYDQGVTLYGENRFSEAAQAFLRAYELRPNPLILYNIGQAYRKDGKPFLALEFYRRFLHESPFGESKLRAETERHVTEIQEELAIQQRALEEAERERESAATSPVAPAPRPPATHPPAISPPAINPPPINPPPINPPPINPPPINPPPPNPQWAGAPPPILPPPTANTPPPPIQSLVGAPPPPKSRAWIAGVIVPVVVTLAVVIGVTAWYLAPAPQYTQLQGIVWQ